MQKRRFMVEQIVGVLHELDNEAKTAEVCRRHDVADATIRCWRQEYDGLQVNLARCLRMLEDENRQLKRIVANQALNLQVEKDRMGKTW